MSAGKGDRPRAVNGGVYRRNYVRIFRKQYPDWVCKTCGCLHGNRPAGNPYGATWHVDECGVCGETVEVTEPRDFGHLKEGWNK